VGEVVPGEPRDRPAGQYRLVLPPALLAESLGVAVVGPEQRRRLAGELTGTDLGLPPTRLGPVHINTARAQLDLGDRDGAETSLVEAWQVAPQMARIHPMSLEVLRVLISLHRRSNPRLVQLARHAGLVG